jgi:hypothetical protein
MAICGNDSSNQPWLELLQRVKVQNIVLETLVKGPTRSTGRVTIRRSERRVFRIPVLA